MGIVGMDLVQVGDRVEAPRHVPDRLASGNAERPQHHGKRGRDLLAEADPVAEEELVDGVGPGRQRRDVLRVVRVGADPVDEGLDLAVRRRVVRGDRPGQRQHAGVRVRQLLLLALDGGRQPDGAVVGPELRRRGGAHLRVDRVDGSGAQAERRDDGAVLVDVQLAGGEPQLVGALRMEHEIRRRARRCRTSADRSARTARRRAKWEGRRASSPARGGAGRAATRSNSPLARCRTSRRPSRRDVAP